MRIWLSCEFDVVVAVAESRAGGVPVGVSGCCQRRLLLEDLIDALPREGALARNWRALAAGS
jgi:hypothetical protein